MENEDKDIESIKDPYIDPYFTLNVPHNASPKDIKEAYRHWTKLYHPDKNPGNPRANEWTTWINAASVILFNGEKREKYDKKRSAILADTRSRSNYTNALPIFWESSNFIVQEIYRIRDDVSKSKLMADLYRRLSRRNNSRRSAGLS